MAAPVQHASPPNTTTEAPVRHIGNGTQSPAHRSAPGRVHTKPFDWPLLWKRVKLWGWNAFTKLCLTILYLEIISRGIRALLTDTGVRLSKIPGLAFLDDYQDTYDLDLAHVAAIVLLAFTWIGWHLLLELFLRPELFRQRFRRWNADRTMRIIISFSTLIIVGDACLFCAAFTLGGWGRPRSSAAAVLATLVYVTALGFSTLIALYLTGAIEEHKKNAGAANPLTLNTGDLT